MKRRVWTVIPAFLVFGILMLGMAALSYKNSTFIFFIELIVSVASMIVVLLFVIRFRNYINKTIEAANVSLSDVSDRYIDQIKTPAAVIGEFGEILVFNTTFKKTFFRDDNPLNESITRILAKEDIETSLTSTSVEVDIYGKKYAIYSRKVLNGELITFIDITKYKRIERTFNETKKSVGLIVFDNYEDFQDNYEGMAIEIMIQVEANLQNWANQNNIFYRKTFDNKYLVIFDEKTLNQQIEGRFEILDTIRKIEYKGRNATISIGIGRNTATLAESQMNARKALDMALGRGGDQVALLDNMDYQFFGGVSRGVERTNNVRIRVIAESIRRELETAERVIIMGHKTSDLDSVGAASGIYAVVKKKFNKPCLIVCDREKSLARDMIDYLSSDDDEKFVSPENALFHVDKKTLLFVVDTHSADFVESRRVLDQCGRIIIIDHHRKMVNHIDDANVNFHNPSASSASEMVTELVSYLAENSINRIEAEALLAGIMLDTKNFVLKTGVATFEAAAFLRKKGADTVEVRDMFANSLESYRLKSELVAKAIRVNNCAITVADEDMENSRVIAAQAADDLLTIKGIYASFVISRIQSRDVNISARSYGKINVQIIMENLGGGGHQTMAATQIKGITLEEARERLIEELTNVEVTN